MTDTHDALIRLAKERGDQLFAGRYNNTIQPPPWRVLWDCADAITASQTALREANANNARLRALLAGAVNRETWQPIETAPKDGSRIMLFLSGPWLEITVARWYEPWLNWQTGALPNDPVRDEIYGIGSLVPTHWRPLPEPPTLAQPEGGDND